MNISYFDLLIKRIVLIFFNILFLFLPKKMFDKLWSLLPHSIRYSPIAKPMTNEQIEKFYCESDGCVIFTKDGGFFSKNIKNSLDFFCNDCKSKNKEHSLILEEYEPSYRTNCPKHLCEYPEYFKYKYKCCRCGSKACSQWKFTDVI